MSTVVNSTTATQPHDRPDRYSKSELAGGTRGRRKGKEQGRKRIGKRGSRHEPNCNQHPTRLDQHLVGSFSFPLSLPLPFRTPCLGRALPFASLSSSYSSICLRWTRVHDETYVHGRPLDASTLLKIGLFSSLDASWSIFLSFSSFFSFGSFLLHSISVDGRSATTRE